MSPRLSRGLSWSSSHRFAIRPSGLPSKVPNSSQNLLEDIVQSRGCDLWAGVMKCDLPIAIDLATGITEEE